MVLLSDGENTTEPDPLVLAELASTAGVRIYPIGLGSPQGTVLEVDGFQVATRLDEATLKQIADTTDGTYYAASDTPPSAGLQRDQPHLDGSDRAPRDHVLVRRGSRRLPAARCRHLGLVRGGWSSLSFALPYALLGLLAVPILVAAYLWQLRRRRRTRSSSPTSP